MKLLPLVSLLLFLTATPLSHGVYVVTGINTTVSLNLNNSAQVVEVLTLSITNASVGQYTTDRLAYNFTLSQWQNIIGSQLVEHIINPRGSDYNFSFVPEPIQSSVNGRIAYLVLKYTSSNVTSVNQTGPRAFTYKFNKQALNYPSAKSGGYLGLNTSLSIVLPQNSKIDAVAPNPDYPALGIAKSYRNVTSLTWDSDESLSQFTLVYTYNESLQDEVLGFFTQVYDYLGGFAYAIIVIGIVALILYTYLRAER